MERNELCWCGSGKKYKKCHLMIEEKIAYHADKGEIVPTRDMLKTIPQIEGIQKSADLNTAVLDHVAAHIHAGMSTAEIDKLVYDYTTEHGGIPAPLNYQGFPKSVCTSINNEICHGIPDENIILEEGDIINVDVSTILDGYFSDASRMFMIGKVSSCHAGMCRTWTCAGKTMEPSRRHCRCDQFTCKSKWLFCCRGNRRTWCWS